ncbi:MULTISPECIES: alanine racemase [Aliivibrio]|uniref:Broad specificity amino-acid racemase n=1 Tax=Aliivibrio finisterrensis TaxID=511998 RepID=A0A4Q5KVQ7_9GAMM|nr:MULTISPECIES: alanine racemase [Aliivibrio]MDD9179954.1 alanine racemase [Aliivibrio sp. A6]RYU49866.1 alanine racemase [Aliivibrio finisterrensis]RYU50488.1 alanine racemase [Aliivibrio finisterrensis]RYU57305.1 alanine racemase [Aliivibrio finisterrensis]RYU62636.1 alanine racemase [Aliivibrio finisterrensis]
MKFTKCALALSLVFPAVANSAPLLSLDTLTNQEKIQQTNAWLEIDTKAFQHNIDTLKQTLSEGTKVCAIMKADAYGNGIEGLMASVIDRNVECIGITSNEEARIVRAKGFEGEIMRVRAATPNEIQSGLEYQIEELIGSSEQANTIAKLAKKNNTIIPVHLALNAGGMGRNGLDLSQLQGKKEALNIAFNGHVNIVGIMTHFPNESVEEIRTKLNLFKQESQWLIDEAQLNRENITLHVANSYTTINLPEAHLDMVRPGGLLYGDMPSNPEYQRIVRFKTSVASLNYLPKGSTIGYSSTYVLGRDSILANLPLGYSDGYVRSIGNNGYVLINGQKANVVGVTSMNTTMVDVTDIADVQPGDEVVLFGSQNEETIETKEMEAFSSRGMPELYVIWGATNPKVYL